MEIPHKQVEELLREAAEQKIIPLWQNLRQGDVAEKTPDEIFVYYRTLVWDHAPGILIAEEAGGFVRRFDGTEYSPLDSRKGLLCASNKEMWEAIQKTLVPTISVVSSD